MPSYFGGSSSYYGSGYYSGVPVTNVESISSFPSVSRGTVEALVRINSENRRTCSGVSTFPALQGSLLCLSQFPTTSSKQVMALSRVASEQWGKEFYDSNIDISRGAENYLNVGTKLLLHSPSDGNSVIDVTPWMDNWEITQARNSAATLKVTLIDKDRALRPGLDAGDVFYGKFNGDNFDKDYNVRKYWQIEVTKNGDTWKSPRFLLLDYSWSFAESASVSLNFTDYSELLLQDGYEMEDFVSDASKVHTAHSIIKAILDNVKIPYRIEFTDYPVLKFSPKGGKALDYIEKLLYVAQAEWRFEDGTFVAIDRNYNVNGPAQWTFVDRKHLFEVSINHSIRDLINEITIKRAEASNIVGEAECEGGNCIGYQTLSLSTPANAATFVIEEISHYAPTGQYTGTWTDANDRVLANGWGYAGGVPAAKFEWVYEPELTMVSYEGAPGDYTHIAWSGGWTPRYRVVAYGRSIAEAANLPQFDEAFTVTVKNEKNQQTYGIRPDRNQIEDTMIPDSATATRLANLLIEESIRRCYEASWGGAIQPHLLPSQMVKVTVGMGGINDQVFFVESVSKSGSPDSVTMQVSMTRNP